MPQPATDAGKPFRRVLHSHHKAALPPCLRLHRAVELDAVPCDRKG